MQEILEAVARVPSFIGAIGTLLFIFIPAFLPGVLAVVVIRKFVKDRPLVRRVLIAIVSATMLAPSVVLGLIAHFPLVFPLVVSVPLYTVRAWTYFEWWTVAPPLATLAVMTVWALWPRKTA
jgi:hypothetical protein